MTTATERLQAVLPRLSKILCSPVQSSTTVTGEGTRIAFAFIGEVGGTGVQSVDVIATANGIGKLSLILEGATNALETLQQKGRLVILKSVPEPETATGSSGHSITILPPSPPCQIGRAHV